MVLQPYLVRVVGHVDPTQGMHKAIFIGLFGQSKVVFPSNIGVHAIDVPEQPIRGFVDHVGIPGGKGQRVFIERFPQARAEFSLVAHGLVEGHGQGVAVTVGEIVVLIGPVALDDSQGGGQRL